MKGKTKSCARDKTFFLSDAHILSTYFSFDVAASSMSKLPTIPTSKENMASPHLQRRPLPRAKPDVTLVIGGDTIEANREALSVQSDFFRGMFSAHFAEREKKEVELFDVPAPIEVVKSVVEFAELYPRSQLDIDDVDGLCGALAVADMMGIR